MKQNLPDIIRENIDLQQALLKQEGGIMKYLAGHLDADGLEALYNGYRNQCIETFRNENKWRMREEIMKREAIGDNHIKKELSYQVALRPVFSLYPNMAEPALDLIEDYLNDTFKKCHSKLYPNVIPDMEFYEKVIIQYSDKVFGKAHNCLWRVLNEHRGKAKTEKDETELWNDFELQKYAHIYFAGEEKLRRAVKVLINEKTQGKDKDECRQICMEEAKNVMRRLWPFAHRVNGDYDLVELRLKEDPRICEIWSTKDLERRGASMSFIEKQKKYITKEEMVWLREGMISTPLQKCFQLYYSVLKEIGCIWSVQLREYGIDIRELEEETGCVLNKKGFYVERSMGGLLGKVCVIEHEDDGVEAKRKAIMEYVGRLKKVVKDDYLSVYDEMWNKILSLESVKSKVYKKGKQKDTTFNRNLVANIIHLMKENGIFKAGTTEVFMARLLEPEDDGKEHEIKGRGENHPVKGALYNTMEDKSNKNDVEKVIMKYQKNRDKVIEGYQ